MNKKAYITPATACVEAECTILALTINTGDGSGSALSNSLDGNNAGSSFDDVQEFDWRE